ncbi:MAG: hypothetical protein KAW61_05585 [candidate division Zixibacteria bacterium]|nr:hypothetical protein [candidate division Zixibacteria bacterium]
MTPRIAIIFCALLVLATPVRATSEVPDSSVRLHEDSSVVLPLEAEDTANFVLSVERLTVHRGRILDTLDVTLESGGNLLAAFDLRLALESRFVEILEILPGEILDSCSWEFFNAKAEDESVRENYPRSLWHVVALAELIPDETRPHCYGIGRRASLVRLVVSSEHVDLAPDGTAAIFFFWESCSDNSIAGVTGNMLSVSAKLYDYYPTGNYESEALFPTRLGAPEQCIDPSVKNPPRRRIEFHNGGIEFLMQLLPDSTHSDSTARP